MRRTFEIVELATSGGPPEQESTANGDQYRERDKQIETFHRAIVPLSWQVPPV
ncbi:hypothetical protein GCM10027296_15710 [Chitinimonas naiadis]